MGTSMVIGTCGLLCALCIIMYGALRAVSALAFACTMAEARRLRCIQICNKKIAMHQRELDLYKAGKSKKTEKEIAFINGVCICEKGYLASIIDEGKFANKMISLGNKKGIFRLWFCKTTIK